MSPIKFSSHYELPGGHFDKDEQGWCTDYMHIICTDGLHVKLREYYDANGIIRYDTHWEGKVQEVREGIVYILLDTGKTLRFSLESNQLVEE